MQIRAVGSSKVAVSQRGKLRLPIVSLISTAVTLAACSSVNRVPGVYYPPRDKPAEVIWSSQESGLDPASYEVIGTAENETSLCGITKAINDPDNHQKLARMGAEIGGDAILLSCGDLGTVGECRCAARVLRFGTGGLRRKSQDNLKGCTTDNDCKGDRVCTEGKCIDPAPKGS